MMHATAKKLFAALLTMIMVMAQAGQQIHIFNEDPERFAAYFSDLIPDDVQSKSLVAKCIVDDFALFTCMSADMPAPVFYTDVLAVLQVKSTCLGCIASVSSVSLRAPPSA